mmetsp:Transcript_42499/g.103112  ORF Transcript_42499/g.103112 Transcript_42499/m.103112 type:complete len:195 (+) Transcript_42499:1055-1639(+)
MAAITKPTLLHMFDAMLYLALGASSTPRRRALSNKKDGFRLFAPRMRMVDHGCGEFDHDARCQGAPLFSIDTPVLRGLRIDWMEWPLFSPQVSLIVPLLATLLLTSGQLFLAPVGLALVSRSAPVHARSTAIGLWFLAGGVAGLLAGQVGVLYSIWKEPSFFLLLAAMCFVGAALMAKVAPRLNRMPLARMASS